MTETRLAFGTAAWFERVGVAMCDAVRRYEAAPGLSLSLVERYVDGNELPTGLVEGLRFDISAGAPSFRIGAWPGEQGDVTIEITRAAARKLNGLRSADPRYPATIDDFLASGKMRVQGDPARLGDWLAAVHDQIVDFTL